MSARIQTALTIVPVTFVLLLIAVAAGSPKSHASAGAQHDTLPAQAVSGFGAKQTAAR
ncbi:hypothetical protein [Azospirillum sp. SYSU D00513]|uniref:hypothetical protein n=1 Tax=Azospirillum sp. SYSU D00513 TaxID=2812561 RepID=UPI001A96B72B|nr:hypothetical protein [Azospirillum sp. SYSU D00513]